METSAFIYQIARFHAKEDREMVRNYHYSLRNDPEERCSQLLRGGSLKSCRIKILNKGGFQSGFI
jgi:hypothetical protein